MAGTSSAVFQLGVLLGSYQFLFPELEFCPSHFQLVIGSTNWKLAWGNDCYKTISHQWYISVLLGINAPALSVAYEYCC